MANDPERDPRASELKLEHRPSRARMSLPAVVWSRRHYALLLGAAFWVLMAGQVVVEGGRWARSGLPLGWDFHIFHSAGALVARGHAAELYDPVALERTARELVPGDYPVFAYLNPPHFAVLMAPLARLSHGVAFALWTAFGLALLATALRLLSLATPASIESHTLGPRGLGYALCSYPVAVGLFAGQNCFLSLVLVAAASLLALHGRAFASGCAVGALLYKPQLALGFLLFFALYRRERLRAFSGFFLVGALLLAVNLGVSLEASRRYASLLGGLPDVQAQFRLALSFTGRAFFEQLMPGHSSLATVLGAITSLACVVGYAVWTRRESRVPVLLAGAVWLTLAATPHASVYEWTLLIAPLLLLRGHLDEQHWALAASIPFLASYLSPPFAEAMVARLGFGIQLAVPALFALAWYVLRSLRQPPAGAPSATSRVPEGS